ncbi:hypothetical protein ACRE_068990 [Hapsidospora chrysogenum ATCC 11550]|uniref:Uncharacterized protein n=1 Tax=Hapsidospora chrysogenum (strain ATCC 11550 / CBS 779.69 / DSM 880 / IAM 14645 / JCM 23072 / IMI 49137) TaxID=857340 RepID=A0A086SZ48_HAPC1|nr:hypothetical protein ACRE_068990 [Hapsidospora chrysogenum ATCC 11550]
MDPEDADAQAMAQMMGFSSFERPQKKRRYNNPAADAVVDTPAPAQQQASTGSNAIPVGNTRTTASPSAAPAPATATANADEISLDDDDDDNDGGQGAPVQHPPPDPTASTIQSGHAKGSGLLLHGLPQRPAPGVPPHNGGRTPGPQRGQQYHQRNNEGQPWYEGYYDSLSNRNPWEKLEKALGLQPRGSWISS